MDVGVRGGHVGLAFQVDVEQALAFDRAAVEKQLLALRGDSHSERPRIARAAWHLLEAGGKRARPLLTCAVERAAGGDPSADMPLVIPSELIHTASLIHDDVLDRAPTRRGLTTVHLRFDRHTAILAGDYLLARALELLARARSRELLLRAARAVSRTVRGQVMESEQAYKAMVTLADLRQVNRLKTASLFAYAAEVGAILAGAPLALRRSAFRYGLLLGEAFQITDDILDWEGDEHLTGKSCGRDLDEGKTTLPLALALRRDADLAEQVRHYWSGDRVAPNGDGFESIRRRVVEAGGLSRARQIAQGLAERASSAIAIFPASGWRELLDVLARKSIYRGA